MTPEEQQRLALELELLELEEAEEAESGNASETLTEAPEAPPAPPQAVYRTQGNPIRKAIFGDDGSQPAPIGPKPAVDPRGFMDRIQGKSEEIEPSGTYPRAVQGTPPLAMPAAYAPAALMKVAQVLNTNAPTRIVVGGAQGALTNPNDPLTGAAVGAGMAAGGEGLGKLLGKAGDVGMQASMGRRKYTPGVGTELADQGTAAWTQGGMRQKVAERLDDTWGRVSSYVDDIDPALRIDSSKIATEVARDAARPLHIPGGKPSVADRAKLDVIREFSEDIGSRGMESSVQGLGRRGAAGRRAYRGKEDPLKTLIGDMSKNEQRHYSTALKDGYRATAPATVPPVANRLDPRNVAQNVQATEGIASRNPEALAQADAAYGALKRASASINEEPMIPKSLWGLLSMGTKSIPGIAGPVSKASSAAVKLGRGVENLADPMVRQAMLEALASDKKK